MTLIEVCTLDSTGDGSTLWALTQAATTPGAHVIGLPGTVTTKHLTRITGDSVTIEGLDMRYDPSLSNPGIFCFVPPGAKNLTLRNCRLYPGRVAHPGVNLDALEIGNDSGARVDTVELDHCTFGFSTDENLSAWGVDNLYIHDCLDWFGLWHAGHPQGAHSMATQFHDCTNLTIEHSAILHCHDRGLKAVKCQTIRGRGNVYLVDRVYDFTDCTDVEIDGDTVLNTPEILINQVNGSSITKTLHCGLNADALAVLQGAGAFPRYGWEENEIRLVVTGGGVKLINSEVEVMK